MVGQNEAVCCSREQNKMNDGPRQRYLVFKNCNFYPKSSNFQPSSLHIPSSHLSPPPPTSICA